MSLVLRALLTGAVLAAAAGCGAPGDTPTRIVSDVSEVTDAINAGDLDAARALLIELDRDLTAAVAADSMDRGQAEQVRTAASQLAERLAEPAATSTEPLADPSPSVPPSPSASPEPVPSPPIEADQDAEPDQDPDEGDGEPDQDKGKPDKPDKGNGKGKGNKDG